MAIKEQLRPTPLFAVVGVGDLVAEKVRTSVDLKTLPEQLKTLPEKAQSAAFGALKDAESAYAGLAQRGETLVGRVRKQQATADLESSARSTEAKVKAATTTAKKSAKQTKSSAKGAATSARKTAGAAKDATAAAAEKVGD